MSSNEAKVIAAAFLDAHNHLVTQVRELQAKELPPPVVVRHSPKGRRCRASAPTPTFVAVATRPLPVARAVCRCEAAVSAASSESEGDQHMQWALMAILAAAAVAVAIAASRLFGRRIAGLFAGMPVITAPTLAWIALEHGVDFAARAAVASVAACGVLACFAWGYERAARRWSPAVAITVSGLGAGALAVVAQLGSYGVGTALLAALLVCERVMRELPRITPAACVLRNLRRELTCTCVAAACVGAAVALAAPWLGPFAAGMVASIPVISGPVAVHHHRTAGASSAARFLSGYVTGLVGKAVFGAVFALLLVRSGVLPALLVATAAGMATAAIALHAWHAGPAPEADEPASPVRRYRRRSAGHAAHQPPSMNTRRFASSALAGCFAIVIGTTMVALAGGMLVEGRRSVPGLSDRPFFAPPVVMDARASKRLMAKQAASPA